ncbi:hypothetical protein EON65_09310 [archaeon]|nr:MAG: hypothetical protein EON65_09310 [archaeon]
MSPDAHECLRSYNIVVNYCINRSLMSLRTKADHSSEDYELCIIPCTTMYNAVQLSNGLRAGPSYSTQTSRR